MESVVFRCIYADQQPIIGYVVLFLRGAATRYIQRVRKN